MAGRISPGPVSSAAALTPGPGAYPKAAAAVDATLPGQPAFTMGVRPSGSAGGGGGGEGGRTASPGPGQYDPADVEVLSGPAWTMGAKLQAPGRTGTVISAPFTATVPDMYCSVQYQTSNCCLQAQYVNQRVVPAFAGAPEKRH
jgi:hypothetical protein